MREKVSQLKQKEKIAVFSYVTTVFRVAHRRRPTNDEVFDRCEELAWSPKDVKRAVKIWEDRKAYSAEIQNAMRKKSC